MKQPFILVFISLTLWRALANAASVASSSSSRVDSVQVDLVLDFGGGQNSDHLSSRSSSNSTLDFYFILNSNKKITKNSTAKSQITEAAALMNSPVIASTAPMAHEHSSSTKVREFFFNSSALVPLNRGANSSLASTRLGTTASRTQASSNNGRNMVHEVNELLDKEDLIV